MLADSDAYQGAVLRAVIASIARPLTVSAFNRFGRLDAFVFDEKVGVFIKYSTKRLSPWRFTFHIEQVAELLDLEIEHKCAFAVFVCGVDGLVTVDLPTLHELVSFQETEQAWFRIDRRPRSLYGVAGNRAELPTRVARGVGPIVTALGAGSADAAKAKSNDS